jgi:NADPH:quinone reductase-like Zn-dependent oxidoreductase
VNRVSQRRRIQYHRYGGPEQMMLERFTPAEPREGQVLVEVRAAAANGLDWKIRRGEMKMLSGRGFPRGLGHDFSGVVEQVGQGVTRFRVGDEVFGVVGMKASGAFAEAVVADVDLVAGKPPELSFEQAAALPTAGVTALQAIENKGRLGPGQSVFINGCVGGVGRIAVQIARNRGIAVAGSCRADTRDDAEALGVSPVVDFDFDATQLTSRFDLVFDTAGTLSGAAGRALLKPGGDIIDINGSLTKMLRSVLPGPHRMQFTKPTSEDLETVAEAVARGQVELRIARTVALSEAIAALTELETRNTPRGGKLVIVTG